MSNTPQEIETRTLFQDFDKASNGLISSGFKKIDSYVQHDIIVDRPDGSLFASGQKIRIRIQKGSAELTFKGKFIGDDSVGRREEINISFPLDDVEKYLRLLKGLGYQTLFQLKKNRAIFLNEEKSIEAVIDEYPIIGYILELEGPERNITKVAEEAFPDKNFKNYRLKELYQSHVVKTNVTLEELILRFQDSPNGYDLGNIKLILK